MTNMASQIQGGGVTSVPPAIAPDSMTHIVALTDQVAAAVTDVEIAWDIFKFGDTSSEQIGKEAMPLPSDRLAYSDQSLMAAVERLHSLAQRIRDRA